MRVGSVSQLSKKSGGSNVSDNKRATSQLSKASSNVSGDPYVKKQAQLQQRA